MFKIGMKRAIEEDDIYAVPNDMQSDQTTETFRKLWQMELKQKKPSILRVILKLHGFSVLTIGMLFSIGETMAR